LVYILGAYKQWRACSLTLDGVVFINISDYSTLDGIEFYQDNRLFNLGWRSIHQHGQLMQPWMALSFIKITDYSTLDGVVFINMDNLCNLGWH
jgi:hypothetical protein